MGSSPCDGLGPRCTWRSKWGGRELSFPTPVQQLGPKQKEKVFYPPLGAAGRAQVVGTVNQGSCGLAVVVILGDEREKAFAPIFCSPHGKVMLFQSCWQMTLELD